MKFAVTKDDCVWLFRKVAYDSKDEAVAEKWRLVGQCLSKICTKRCTWFNLDVRASAPNVCNLTTVAEEAIVYWLFVSEGEGWVKDFVKRESSAGSHDKEDASKDGTASSQRKRCGQHKSMEYLKHWLQLKSIVKKRRANREISDSWDEALMLFAVEEKNVKKTNKEIRKATTKDVLPKFEDVLGVGEEEGGYSTDLEFEEDLPLFTQLEEV